MKQKPRQQLAGFFFLKGLANRLEAQSTQQNYGEPDRKSVLWSPGSIQLHSNGSAAIVSRT